MSLRYSLQQWIRRPADYNSGALHFGFLRQNNSIVKGASPKVRGSGESVTAPSTTKCWCQASRRRYVLFSVQKCHNVAVDFSNSRKIPKADVSEILLCRHDGAMCENVEALFSVSCLYIAYSDDLQCRRCKYIYPGSCPTIYPSSTAVSCLLLHEETGAHKCSGEVQPGILGIRSLAFHGLYICRLHVGLVLACFSWQINLAYMALPKHAPIWSSMV